MAIKMSDIMKEMAQKLLKRPRAEPSAEAAHAALLLANVAWDRATGIESHDYLSVLKVFEDSLPTLWKEFKSRDCEKMIEKLIRFKKKKYPNDFRRITVCGMREGNVRVEWTEPLKRNPGVQVKEKFVVLS